MMNDLIYRQEAIEAMQKLEAEDIDMYGVSIPEGFDGERAVKALRELPSAEPEPPWIPATEELPNHELALVQFSDGDFCLLQFPTAYRRKDIVAWMPKPKPWKGEQDG